MDANELERITLEFDRLISLAEQSRNIEERKKLRMDARNYILSMRLFVLASAHRITQCAIHDLDLVSNEH